VVTHLLDTDTCIDLLRGKTATVSRAEQHAPASLAISSVTAYELNYGVERCPPKWQAREGRKVRMLLEQLHVLPFTEATARHAATLRAALDDAGRPIGPMDVLIAATALEHALLLVTGNVSEFQRVPGLRCESWSA
jgi:tRNA(fMet)-specific endonuclease VapC